MAVVNKTNLWIFVSEEKIGAYMDANMHSHPFTLTYEFGLSKSKMKVYL